MKACGITKLQDIGMGELGHCWFILLILLNGPKASDLVSDNLE